MALQGVDLPRQFLNAVKRHDAHLGIFQRYGVAGMVVVHNAIQPHYLTCHLETGHLVPAVFRGHASLEKTGPDRIEAGKFLAISK